MELEATGDSARLGPLLQSWVLQAFSGVGVEVFKCGKYLEVNIPEYCMLQSMTGAGSDTFNRC